MVQPRDRTIWTFRSVQGAYGGRTVASAYNPWTGAYGATSQGRNAYAQWGSSVATRGNQWEQSAHVTTAPGTAAAYQNSAGQAGVVRSGGNGTVADTTNGVYAGHDGNIYRKNSNRNWSQYNNGNWNQVDSTAAKQTTQQNLQNAKQQGSQNLQNARQQGTAPQRTGATSVSPDTLQGLNNSALSRQRGQAQTQRFQTSRPSGGARQNGARRPR